MRLRNLLVFILTILFFSTAIRFDTAKGDTGETQLLNDRSSEIIGADLLNAPGFITPAGLTGKGQLVAVADSGIDKGSIEDIHPDLISDSGKKPGIIMLKSWAGREKADDPVGHGTHMVGTIIGNGKSSGGKFKGLAPDASIYFQGILDEKGRVTPPSDIEKLFMPAYEAGARIHVDAWGSGQDSYSNNAARVDAFIRKYPDFLVIFGAGNSGPAEKSLTREANSKNALVVGASVSPRPALDFSPDGTLDTADFSSRGPAGDGRIKPDLLAPGTSIISTRSSLVTGNLPGFPMYTRMQGTSMASAVAAGSAALLRQYLQQEAGIKDPMASTLKAALINGARTGDKGPSREGFGVLDLAGTVLALKEKTMSIAEEKPGLAQGDVKTYQMNINDADAPLKITLAWTDPAGNTSANTDLVNDLDLTVIAPDGKKFTGNGFLGQSPDAVNNVEQVYIKNPLPGDYTVEIKAASINALAGTPSFAIQDYSLVYGQLLSTGIIKETGAKSTVTLYGGETVNLSDRGAHYILNGHSSGSLKPESGYRIYYSKESAYIVGRRWDPESARYRESASGRIWFEAGGDSREGGYYQNPESGKGVIINGSYSEDISDIPPGAGLNASLDGVTQTLWKVVTGYGTIKGNVSGIVNDQKENVSAVRLFNDSREFRVSKEASYIFSDTFEGNDPLEEVFGAGGLDGLHKIMPGQQVTLVLSPVSGLVSSVLVNRNIVSGYITGIESRDDKMVIGQNPGYHILSGAGIQKDHSPSSINKLEPGDYAMAVILPGSRKILGLAAYSSVIYGQVLFTSDRDKSVYINDLGNRFRILAVTPDTEVWRWGLESDMTTLSSGTWVRATLSPDGKGLWRMDVAELLEDEQKAVESVSSGQLVTADGMKYQVSPTTTVTKEGFPVTLQDLKPREAVIMELLLAPESNGKVPVAIRARELEGVKKPLFMAAVLEEKGRLMLSGYTSGDRLYVWHEDGVREDVPVAEGPGSFSWQLKFHDNDSIVKVITLDSQSGAVTGKSFNRSEITGKKFVDIAGHWAENMVLSTAGSGIMAGYGDGTFRPDNPVTIGELALIWAEISGNKNSDTPK
ncbi:MAG: S8 family serine peptidase, partial [Actinobacteria bacterium]|nr:S8 family serine peptidase [Actinomycetota bacterium]